MVCGGTFKYKDKLVLDNYLHTPSQGEEVGLVTRIIFTQVYYTLIHPAPTESKRFYFPEQRPQRSHPNKIPRGPTQLLIKPQTTHFLK